MIKKKKFYPSIVASSLWALNSYFSKTGTVNLYLLFLLLRIYYGQGFELSSKVNIDLNLNDTSSQLICI